MGKLSVVATPIGNLEDITFRALRVLKEADLILCEDTRHASKLLNHYDIKATKLSYHQHNERTRSEKVLSLLKEGKNVALISDAGTPGISDPGQILVHVVLEAGIPVETIPGPCAITAAISVCGFSSDPFVFDGFLPPKQKARRECLSELVNESRTLVFYEAPHRLIKALTDLKEIFGDRQGLVARELTKLHEELRRGTLDELLTDFSKRPSIKGEIVLIVEGASEKQRIKALGSKQSPKEEALKLISELGLSKREAAKQVAHTYQLSSRKLYQDLIEP